MTYISLLHRRESLFIGGRWLRADTAPLAVANPSTGGKLGEIAPGRANHVEAAVQAATTAFPAWSRLASRRRAEHLSAFAAGLGARREMLIELQMSNNGKPRFEAELDVSDAVATFEYYADLAATLDERQDREVPVPDAGYRARLRQEPVGPVGLIVPWNFPLVTSAWKLAPALAAGCTVVLKTSEFTPFAELVYADIAAESGLPAGVLNIVTGAAEAGEALVANPLLRKVSFTGSNRVGALVMRTLSERTAPVSLELGGKSPILIFADANLDAAVDFIVSGMFTNAGQMCSATSRLLADRTILPDLVDKLTARVSTLKVGSPFEDDTEMGPLTTLPQFERVRQVLNDADADGLKPLAGGKACDVAGFFIEPTVYLDVPDDHAIWQREIFGPVLTVRGFADEDEAVRLANDTDYGLVATLVSPDKERTDRVAAAPEAGMVWVNSQQVIFPQTSWGGFKASGIGRELGPWGLSAFTGVKHVVTAQDQ